MAEKYSTGLRNFLAGRGSMREALDDAVIKLYTGPAPSSPDSAASGTLLCTLTKASGSVNSTDRSTPKRYKITIGSHGSGETFIFDLTVDGVGPTSYTYTNTPDAGDADAVAKLVARMLNDIPQIQAIAAGSNGEIYVQGRIAGLDFTLAKNDSSTGTITVSLVEDANAVNTLKLGPPSAGVISKTDDEWSGVNIATGTPGYFRIVRPDDNGAASTTAIRIQGTVSTVGADMNFSSINFVAEATTKLTNFSITFKESA